MSDMDIYVQLASIASPIIAIIIAWIMLRCSAKDTAKQIKALEESTTKQVESVKALARNQIEATIHQVELEIAKNILLARQAQQEGAGIQEINNSGLSNYADWKQKSMQQFLEKKPERDFKLYSYFINELEGIRKSLVDNKNKLS